jgi:hypothetical protein
MKAIAALIVLFMVAAGGFYLSWRNFRECRAFGHSWVYCFTSERR